MVTKKNKMSVSSSDRVLRKRISIKKEKNDENITQSRKRKVIEKIIEEKEIEKKRIKLKNVKQEYESDDEFREEEEDSLSESESEYNESEVESEVESENGSENESESGSDFEKKKNRKRIVLRKIKKEKIGKTYINDEIDDEEYPDIIPQLAVFLRKNLKSRATLERKNHSYKYFKTDAGDYGEGDNFFGTSFGDIGDIKRKNVPFDIETHLWLFTSPYHEERVISLMGLVFAIRNINRMEKKMNSTRNTKRKIKNEKDSYNVVEEINQLFKKYKCNSIPELIKTYFSQEGRVPGERKKWDILDDEVSTKRQKEKLARAGESRPIFLDYSNNAEKGKDDQYEYKSNLKLKNEFEVQKQAIFEFYIELLPWVDNWNLVDVSCVDIVGNFLEMISFEQGMDMLYEWLKKVISPKLVGGIKVKQNTKQKKTIKKENKENKESTEDKNISINNTETSMWTKRVAIVGTFHFIRLGEFRYTFLVAEKLFNVEEDEEIKEKMKEFKKKIKENKKSKSSVIKMEDLVQKGIGWMLREIGKRDGTTSGPGCKLLVGKESSSIENKVKISKKDLKKIEFGNTKNVLLKFLDKYSWYMPRTVLRYAIERFSEDLKFKYMNSKGPL